MSTSDLQRSRSSMRRNSAFYILPSLAFALIFLYRSSPVPYELPSAVTELWYAKREEQCNPFTTLGRLKVDLDQPTNTAWRPYDKMCKPSTFMSRLYQPRTGSNTSSSSEREVIPWLMNRTIVLHGDSIDRYHLKDFCEMVGGRLFSVGNDHPAVPRPYRKAVADESALDAKVAVQELTDARKNVPEAAQHLTNPWVCNMEDYGATLVSVFTFGLGGGERFFETQEWYHEPAMWIDRLEFILAPLLVNLAAHLRRPQITSPDLIELNAGYWDLRRYTEEDFFQKGFTSRPYPNPSSIPNQNLGADRLAEWERQARIGIKAIARTFTGPKGKARTGPTILWRTLHHPHNHDFAPTNRVYALDDLARNVVSDLQNESSSKYRRKHPAALERVMREEAVEGEDLGLDERLRVSNHGKLLEGQENHFRDLLHANAVPGSYLWGDVMLFELKRAVAREGRS